LCQEKSGNPAQNSDQCIGTAGSVETVPNMDVLCVWTWLESKRQKLQLLVQDLYLVSSILRLIDMATGEINISP
jgi:hypothetical protein